MKQMASALLDNQGQESTQRVMIISGLAGSGKTQISLKFAREFEDR
jgi:signal recognition particle GTPase